MATRGKVRPKTLEEMVAFAVGHRIRIEALTIFNERVASPSEVAAETGETLSNVGHHIKELLDAKCIELVRIEPRGGSAEHFYRAVRRPQISDAEWRAMPGLRRREIVAMTFRNLIAEGLASIRAGKMDADDDLTLFWRSANLDNEGRREAALEQAESLARLAEIEARSNARLAERGERGASIILAVLGFPRSREGQPSEDVPLPGDC